MKRPERKVLPHEIPWWVSQGARHFITINAAERGGRPFLAMATLDTARSETAALPVAQQLLESLIYYETIGKWYLWLAVVMPDHLHFIATFNMEKGIKSVLIDWKRYQAKTLGLELQRDYFEHRIRDQDAFVKKSAYIRNNPVRQGLVDIPEAWPYIWHRSRLAEVLAARSLL